MPVRYTDAEIEEFIAERKPLPEDYLQRLQPRGKGAQKKAELDVIGTDGNEFRIIVRQNTYNSLDFSIVLALCPRETTHLFHLRRYNGKSHEHTNVLEQESFYAFHIHVATARYQELGGEVEKYAERTERYATCYDALACMFEDCAFEPPPEEQLSLFEEG